MTHELTDARAATRPDPDDDARPSPGRAGRRHRVVVTTSIVVALTGCGVGATGTTQPPTPAEVSASTASMPAEGPIAPGTYQIPSSAWSVADFTVTFPPGWAVQYGHVYSKHEDQDDEIGFYAVVVDQTYTDACHGEGVPEQVGPRVDDLVAALLTQPGPEASGPVDTTLGGHPASRIDFTTPEGLDLQSCRLADAGVLGLQVWYSARADKYFVLLPDGIASAYILDVDGQRQVFLTQHREATTPGDVAELQQIVDSIRIAKPSA